MARVVVGSYLVRFPVGGYMSWVLQFLVGFRQLGHEVFFVEKAEPGEVYDPVADRMGDDGTHGTRLLDELLRRFDLEGNWCFVDPGGQYHGLSRPAIERTLDGADVFIDMGDRGAWAAETPSRCIRVLIDGEPGTTQMRWARRREAGGELPPYDHYFTVGHNVAAGTAVTPDLGIDWQPIFDPVVTALHPVEDPPHDAAFTTVMSWQATTPIEYGGRTYGMKDVEFERFIELPRHTSERLEIAVAGANTPLQRLTSSGWSVRDAHATTTTYDAFVDYIRASKGEFSVAKGVFVATQSGFFSDRSAVYLACGRPVVLQETGFSAHLPCGEGLFAVASQDEAAAAIAAIAADYPRHSRAARRIAREFLDTRVVLSAFLRRIGVT
jgi:hypothetical protein